MPKPATTGLPRSKRFTVKRDTTAGEILSAEQRNKPGSDLVTVSKTRLKAVLEAAGAGGLLRNKSGRISGRVSPALVERAKQATGLETDTALIEFALANVALDDGFGEALVKARGTVDPDLTLGF